MLCSTIGIPLCKYSHSRMLTLPPTIKEYSLMLDLHMTMKSEVYAFCHPNLPRRKINELFGVEDSVTSKVMIKRGETLG